MNPDSQTEATKTNSADCYLYKYNPANYMDRNNPEVRQAKKQLLKESYSSAKRRVEIFVFVLFLVLFPAATLNFVASIYKTITSLSGFLIAIPVVAGAISGLLFADFMSGLVHWMADTWGTLEWPIIGKTFIRSFREHHVSPSAMCNHDIIETNSDNLMLVLPVLIYLTFKKLESTHAFSSEWFSFSFWLFAAVGIALTNQIHKWSHTYRPPTIVVWLQNSGIILPKDNHLIHHRPAFDGYYCITTGWLNPVLEKIKFWRGLENIISSLTGLVPREDDYKWTGLVEDTPDVVKKYISDKTNVPVPINSQ